MTKYIISVFFLGFLLFGKQHSAAQNKNLEISDALAANSEKLKVKMGTQWMGKIWKFKFGDYAVTDSKSGWVATTTNKKNFSLKEESKSDQKFSFVLRGKTSESAIVNVVFVITTEELQMLDIFSNYYFGPDSILLRGSQNFTAFIATSNNETENWVLNVKISQGNEMDYKQEAFLTNGERMITILPISSNDNGNDSRMYPALGYEFVENNQPLCAMQYYGGGALGYNKSIIWLATNLEPRTKLILAAAMTSLLQKHADEMGESMH
jgi:hypothetical protein